LFHIIPSLASWEGFRSNARETLESFPITERKPHALSGLVGEERATWFVDGFCVIETLGIVLPPAGVRFNACCVRNNTYGGAIALSSSKGALRGRWDYICSHGRCRRSRDVSASLEECLNHRIDHTHIGRGLPSDWSLPLPARAAMSTYHWEHA
jgi:hypothetical protein